MQDKIKILILEHDPNDIRIIQRELKKGNIDFVAEIVQTEKDYENSIRNFEPDIILSDFTLPTFSGPLAFKMREKIAPHTPFIFVSGTIGEEYSIEYIKNGVTDFVLKERIYTLATKVNRALEEAEEKKEKLKIEYALIQSESRLARAQEIAHIGNWELDFATNTLVLSGEGCRIFGIEPHENHLSYKTWSDLVHPKDLAFVLKEMAESRETLTDVAYQHRIIRADGIMKHIYSESKFEFDTEGKTIGMYGILQDVTVKKEAEEKIKKISNLNAFIGQVNQKIIHIKEEKDLFRNACRIACEFGKFEIAWIGLVDNGHKKIILVDQTGVPDKYMPLFESIPCKPGGPQEHVLRTGTWYVSNDIQNDVALVNWKVPAAELGINSCMWLAIKKGGKVAGTLNLYSTEPDFFDKEKVALLVEVTADISFALDLFENARKKKEVEAQVVESSRQLEFDQHNLNALINNTNDLMWSVDRDFNLITANKPFDEMSMLNFGRLVIPVANVLDVAFTPEMKDHFKQLYERAFVGESFTTTDHFEIPTEFWTEISYYPIRKGDEVIGTACQSRDITKSKKAEIEIQELNETLEARVQERTAELTESNKALEAFSYSVSHDLRAPVRAVTSFTKIIQKEYSAKMEPEVKELFGYIEESGKRMGFMIEDLLKLAKYGNEKLRLEPVDMDYLINGIWLNISRTTPHHAKLELGALPEVIVDMSMMQQVIVNLLSNAIKYSSKKEHPVVTIWCEQKDDKATFYFKDNGAGFDMENSDQLFGAFQRLHAARDFEGTGVGLTLVKRIIEKHGGTVGAEGKVGEGATFYFTLPFHENDGGGVINKCVDLTEGLKI